MQNEVSKGALATILAQRFLLPYLIVRRSPTEAEVAAELLKLRAKGVGHDDLHLFALTIRDVFDEAAALMATTGSA